MSRKTVPVKPLESRRWARGGRIDCDLDVAWLRRQARRSMSMARAPGTEGRGRRRRRRGERCLRTGGRRRREGGAREGGASALAMRRGGAAQGGAAAPEASTRNRTSAPRSRSSACGGIAEVDAWIDWMGISVGTAGRVQLRSVRKKNTSGKGPLLE